jgi:hypothetical protein
MAGMEMGKGWLGSKAVCNGQRRLHGGQYRGIRSDVNAVCTRQGIGKGQTANGRKVLVAGTAYELEPATFLKGN